MNLRRHLLATSILIGTMIAAGCGGGGGGGSTLPGGGVTQSPATPIATATPVTVVTPIVTAGPSATPTPVGNAGCSAASGSRQPCSTFTVNSNPSGSQVLLNGSIVGTTPYALVPSPSNTANVVVVRTSGAPDYTVLVNQLRNGPQTIFYNRPLDTTGSIANSYQSVERTTASFSPAGVVRRPVSMGARGRPMLDETQVFVKYRTSALRQTGRLARDVERFEGLSDGNDVGPEQNGVQTRVVAVPAGQTVSTVASRLSAHAEVVKTDRVHLRYLQGTPIIPNDPHYGTTEQWDMRQIQMPQAWSYTLGTGVTIAMLDSGYDSTSKDFAKVQLAQTFLNGAAGVSGASDVDGHGSNTGGIAGAVTNNGFGFAGVGYNAGLQIYRIIDNNGNINTADEANALYAAVNNGARVINLSIGGSQIDSTGTIIGYDDTEFAAISYALQHNVVVVAAAGNESQPYVGGVIPTCNSVQPACGVSTLDFPAAYPGVIAVGASALADNGTEYVASYSNGGPGLGLVAPGGDPSSSSDLTNTHWIENLSSPLNKQYPCSALPPDGVCANQFAGTSQATPHVSGAAALILAINPGLTPAQVAQLLESTTDYLPNINVAYQAHGRLNVARALAKLTGDTTYPTLRPNLQQFIAFAYTNSGAASAAPQIIDLTYTSGVTVNADGTFRIADINPSSGYKIGVWYDANGDGKVDAGDYFAATGTCSTTTACNANNLVVAPLQSNIMP